jgi:hypothetical protein
LTAVRTQACGFERFALGRNAIQKIVPGLGERRNPFSEQLGGYSRSCQYRPSRIPEYLAGIPGQGFAKFFMSGEGFQRGLGHGIDGEGGGERLDVQRIRRFGILGSGAGKKQALGTGTGVEDALPARRVERQAITLINLSSDGDAKLVPQVFGSLVRYRNVPATDKERSNRTDVGIQSGSDTPLDAAQVSLSRCDILCCSKTGGSR